jgi:hypothetical protein
LSSSSSLAHPFHAALEALNTHPLAYTFASFVFMQLMEEQMLPSLRKLEAQCAEYHEYAVTSQTHERLKRFCVAWDYQACQK